MRENDSFDMGTYKTSDDTAPYSQSARLKSLWLSYSQRVPRLYAAPIHSNMAEVLARLAQVSAELDQMFVKDRGVWMSRFTQVRSELVEAAVAGEREGARVLSFQYAQQSSSIVDALSWAMIANAIAENPYYLYVCFDGEVLCNEDVFRRASQQAQTIIHDYSFTLIKLAGRA